MQGKNGEDTQIASRVGGHKEEYHVTAQTPTHMCTYMHRKLFWFDVPLSLVHTRSNFEWHSASNLIKSMT